MSQTTDQKGQVLVNPDVEELEKLLARQDLNTQELLGVIALQLVKLNIHLEVITEEKISDSEIHEGHGVGR